MLGKMNSSHKDIDCSARRTTKREKKDSSSKYAVGSAYSLAKNIVTIDNRKNAENIKSMVKYTAKICVFVLAVYH